MTSWTHLCIWDMYRQDRDPEGRASLCLFRKQAGYKEKRELVEKQVRWQNDSFQAKELRK